VRDGNLKYPRNMALVEMRWSSVATAVYVVRCGYCPSVFLWPWGRDRVRCPGCGAEANLPTLQVEWAGVSREDAERQYYEAYQNLRAKVKDLFDYNDSVPPDAQVSMTAWLRRVREKWDKGKRKLTTKGSRRR
jgi:hypothetical protein